MGRHVTPKKSLGQHFLADAGIARKIAGSLTGHGNYGIVLEVGPGTGMLSRQLMEIDGFRWYGMDVDRESIAALREKPPEMASRIIHADFLRCDFPALFGQEPLALIGNFPYNISSQIVFKLLENRHQVPEMVGMFQKEVALRIASPPGSKVYGILSVLTQAFYRVELLFHVGPHVFVPPPRVDSTVIRCRRKENYHLGCNEKLFFSVVKTAFNQRRKTLRNSLRGMQLPWESLPSHLPGERPEQLGVDDFVLITRQLPSRPPLGE